MRFHPILGYSRMHRGVRFRRGDWNAVYAAGDGVVSLASRVSGYGNYIEIEHNQEYATAYGHLKRVCPRPARGCAGPARRCHRLCRMTGMATGPHLHYEVHDHGTQIDRKASGCGADAARRQRTEGVPEHAQCHRSRLARHRHDLVATAAEKGQAAAAP